MSVVFENNSLVDIRAIKTFGVSAKEGDSPIGFFGTGLKYAIAILLRNKQSIEIFVGTDRYAFDTVTVKIRNDEFEIIRMNGEELGFTTHVGAKWELWQAFRELHTNCIDEGGRYYAGKYPEEGTPGHTKVVVRGQAFTDLFENLSNFYLDDEPDISLPECEIRKRNASSIFYLGYKAYPLSPDQSLFTYNILSRVQLTEDRTITYEFQAKRHIRNAIFKLEDEQTLRRIMTAPEGYYENELDFNEGKPPETFMKVATQLVKNRGIHINPSIIALVRELAAEALTPATYIPTEYEQKLLNKGIEYAKMIGYPVEQYPIIIVERLGDGVLGMAEKGNCYISKDIFPKGVKEIVTTLIEEYIHLEYGYPDFSRQLQNYLFDKLVSMGMEHIVGEPL